MWRDTVHWARCYHSLANYIQSTVHQKTVSTAAAAPWWTSPSLLIEALSLYFVFHWLHCWCCTLPTTILYLTVWQWTPSSLLLSTWEPSCWLQSAFLDNIPKTMTNWLWWFWNQKSFGKSFVYDLYSQQQCLIFKRQAQSLGILSFPGHGQIEKNSFALLVEFWLFHKSVCLG